jgi:RimJ/RimL family protein N-acetyltransferase
VTAAPPSRSDVVVRSVRWNDFDDLVENYYRLYDERDGSNPSIGITLHRDRPSREDEVAWFAGRYRAVLAGDEIFSVAEVRGRVVGSCSILRQAPLADSENGHVATLGILVHPDHRGTGIGTALLTHALAEARTRFEVVELKVFAINERARRLYERFGFVVTGHHPRAVKRNGRYLDDLEMALVFDAAATPGASP